MISKNKLSFIARTITKPSKEEDEYSEEANVWEMVNSMLMSWTKNVIDPRLHKRVAYVGVQCLSNYGTI